MKLTMPRTDLARVLAVASRVVPSRHSLPILSCVRLEARESGIRLDATDLEMSITVEAVARIHEPGVLAVPARLLGELVSSLTGDTLDLASGNKGNSLEVRSEGHRSSVRCLDPDDFPAAPTIGEAALTLPASALRAGLAQVAYAIAHDDVRPALSGALFRAREGKLTLVGADGYRLAAKALPCEGEIDCLVPRAAVAELLRLLPGDETAVRIGLVGPHGSTIAFVVGSLALTSRLVEGAFPNYQALIPTESPTLVSVEVKRLARAVRVAAPFGARAITASGGGNETTSILYVTAYPDGEGRVGRLVVQAAGEAGEAEEEIPASVTGPALAVAVDARYLAEALAACPSESAFWGLQSPTRPTVLRPAGDDSLVTVQMLVHSNKLRQPEAMEETR